MNHLNNKQLLINLIKLLPKNIYELIDHLVCYELINEPIIHLKQSIEQFVINEIQSKTHLFLDQNNHSFDYKKCQQMSVNCEAIIDMIWEKMNCCQWDEVVVDFRYVFAYISLIKALLQIYLSIDSNINHNRHQIIALNALDFGLIMSPTLNNNILAKFATIIHKCIVNEEYNESIDTRLHSKRKLNDFQINNSFVSKSIKLDQNNCDKQTVEQNVDQKYLQEMSGTESGTEMTPNEKIIPYFDENNSNHSVIRVKHLDLETFRDKYLMRKRPLIITDCMRDWPSISSRKWTIDYILKVAAFRTVPIEIGSKYTDEEWSQKLMTIKEFINEYIVNTEPKRIGYLAQHNLFDQIEELRADFSIPDFCCLSREDIPINVDINAWFGPKLTVSPLHFDAKDNLLTQVMGSKYVRLYSDQTPKQFIYPNECKLLCNTSQIDLENVNHSKFPLFNKIDNYYECVLNEGEMLFIPKKYWHFVKSLSTSFSISFWWE